MQTMDISSVIIQKYKDGTYEEALAQGYDMFQPKYDGWNARIEIRAGWVTWYSKTGRVFKQICYPDYELDIVLYSESMFGTQWSQRPERADKTYVYDVYRQGAIPVGHLQYRERFALLRSIAGRLPALFELTENFPIGKFEEFWKSRVGEGTINAFEGVVFRKRSDKIDGTIIRQKATVTEDLQALDFIPGEGKHSGRLGSIRGRTKEGAETVVGGGFSDDERIDIWNNPEKYRMRWFEVEARARFESGALRHPNFIRWRDDK